MTLGKCAENLQERERHLFGKHRPLVVKHIKGWNVGHLSVAYSDLLSTLPTLHCPGRLACVSCANRLGQGPCPRRWEAGGEWSKAIICSTPSLLWHLGQAVSLLWRPQLLHGVLLYTVTSLLKSLLHLYSLKAWGQHGVWHQILRYLTLFFCVCTL